LTFYQDFIASNFNAHSTAFVFKGGGSRKQAIYEFNDCAVYMKMALLDVKTIMRSCGNVECINL